MKHSTILSIGLLLMLVLAACRSSAAPVTTTTTTVPTLASTDSSTSIAGETGPGAPGPAEGSSADVMVRMFQFTPAEFTIEAGQVVTWINADRIDHTITSGTPENPTTAFDMTLPEAGSTATVSFEDPGMYDYFCGIHPHMRATIVVESIS